VKSTTSLHAQMLDGPRNPELLAIMTALSSEWRHQPGLMGAPANDDRGGWAAFQALTGMQTPLPWASASAGNHRGYLHKTGDMELNLVVISMGETATKGLLSVRTCVFVCQHRHDCSYPGIIDTVVTGESIYHSEVIPAPEHRVDGA